MLLCRGNPYIPRRVSRESRESQGRTPRAPTRQGPGIAESALRLLRGFYEGPAGDSGDAWGGSPRGPAGAVRHAGGGYSVGGCSELASLEGLGALKRSERIPSRSAVTCKAELGCSTVSGARETGIWREGLGWRTMVACEAVWL